MLYERIVNYWQMVSRQACNEDFDPYKDKPEHGQLANRLYEAIASAEKLPNDRTKIRRWVCAHRLKPMPPVVAEAFTAYIGRSLQFVSSNPIVSVTWPQLYDPEKLQALVA